VQPGVVELHAHCCTAAVTARNSERVVPVGSGDPAGVISGALFANCWVTGRRFGSRVAPVRGQNRPGQCIRF
jgi:hypothetical protein